MSARRPLTVSVAIAAAAVVTLVGQRLADSRSAATARPPSATQRPAAIDAAEHATYDVGEARAALAALVIADRHLGGYARDLFGDGWTVTGGCTTRQHVLADEAVAGVIDGCDVHGGAWIDWYSPEAPTLTDANTLDVDHLVPLAHAWQSGAWAWSPQQRLAFANDLTNATTLTVVSAGQNRAKADAPPDAWQPPDHGARCTYAKDWIATKTAWALTATTAEIAALEQMLERCDH